MTARAWLFVPGDSERKLAKAEAIGSDVLILDLEDAVAAERRPAARGLVREYLAARAADSGARRSELWVRINPLASADALADLAGVMPGAPDGIVVPKTDSGAQVATLAHYLDALEAREGIRPGRTRIVPVATETAAAVFSLGSYAGVTARLAGLTWGAEDLPAALGASTNRGPDGELAFVYQLARALCLAGAVAAGVQPVDTVYPDFRDSAGLEKTCARARMDGFTGKIAIHPDQVPVIQQAFSPSEAEVAHARRVVAAFRASPGVGTVGLDGQMLDMPHLKQAERVLQIAGASERRPP
ncbi:MAG TPA: CoA ester lyase [Myxococcota bacterium]|nr:CoA ester lyase [Myxococcota bacterium]